MSYFGPKDFLLEVSKGNVPGHRIMRGLGERESVNNGAAGAPYYAQEVLPWSEHTQSFSVENALCLFYVEGSSVKMRVLNPDTLNEIESVTLRE